MLSYGMELKFKEAAAARFREQFSCSCFGSKCCALWQSAVWLKLDGTLIHIIQIAFQSRSEGDNFLFQGSAWGNRICKILGKPQLNIGFCRN